MFEKFLNNVFGNNENQAKKRTAPVKGRKLSIEPLEKREMLAISWEAFQDTKGLRLSPENNT